MFVAHLPVGYLSARALPARWQDRGTLGAALLGSVFPDVDLLYFYWPLEWGGGGRQVHHHAYWTHIPFFWLAALLAVPPVLYAWRRDRAALLSLLFLGNGVVHLVLDSLVGSVMWLYPTRKTLFAVVEVPAHFGPGGLGWVLNFVLHWSFLVEIFLLAGAILVYRRTGPPEPGPEGGPTGSTVPAVSTRSSSSSC